MKYPLLIVLIALTSCKKTVQEVSPVPVVFKDSFSVKIHNNLPSDITNVIAGRFNNYHYFDDAYTQSVFYRDLGQLEKDSSTTIQFSIKGWSGPLVVWFDFLSLTYFTQIPTHGYDKTYLLNAETESWFLVDKTSNAYPQ